MHDEFDQAQTKSFPRHLCNQLDTPTLKSQLAQDTEPRVTVSFYQYRTIPAPLTLRNEYYSRWMAWRILGRIYLANEGINAQMSVPETHYADLQNDVQMSFPGMTFKEAVQNDQEPFYKLIIKVKQKIVADGLTDETFDPSNVGTHLSAREFHAALDEPNTVVVDVRNHYESEVGRFEGAITPDVDTFREELPVIKDLLAGKENQKILLYCTGGIRCEKASAWLKHHGFKDVNQLHGGIVDYAKQIREQGLSSRFLGKNFVFDNRLGERITADVLAKCHLCNAAADSHLNCAWQGCHVLIILCAPCQQKFENCCSQTCMDRLALPIEEQRQLLKSVNTQPRRFSKGRPSASKKVQSRVD